jgi:hypothetical protein
MKLLPTETNAHPQTNTIRATWPCIPTGHTTLSDGACIPQLVEPEILVIMAGGQEYAIPQIT